MLLWQRGHAEKRQAYERSLHRGLVPPSRGVGPERNGRTDAAHEQTDRAQGGPLFQLQPGGVHVGGWVRACLRNNQLKTYFLQTLNTAYSIYAVVSKKNREQA